MESEASGSWEFESIQKSAIESWTLKGNLSYLIEWFMGFMMDDMLGGDFEKGLANLKKNVKNRSNYFVNFKFL